MLHIIKNILSKQITKKKSNHPEWQLEIISSVEKYTMTTKENLVALTDSIQFIIENNIKGDIVECGVWKGGSMMAVIKTLTYFNNKDRHLYLYDTFDIFSTPEKIDVTYDGKRGEDVLVSLSEDGLTWRAPNLISVKDNILLTGYPENLIHFIKGDVTKTIPDSIPEQIALLRLDTDWYASTKHEMEWLFPKLSKGGILIIDDYGYWKGCKKAVDEYFITNNIKSSLKKIDFSARMMIKE